jgi:hypothetical protein
MTDEQLIALLDTPVPYFVAAGRNALAVPRSLRRALATAHKFAQQRLTVAASGA